MTRAMDTLVMTRARYRRRYGSDMPEPSIPSRFLEEVPAHLVEDLGSPPARHNSLAPTTDTATPTQPHIPKPTALAARKQTKATATTATRTKTKAENEARPAKPSKLHQPQRIHPKPSGAGQSIDNIASFFAARGQKITKPKLDSRSPPARPA